MPSLRLVAVCGAALAVLSIAVSPEQAQARPQYRAAFAKKYPELKELEAEKKCAVCHPKADDKKVNNYYGVALKGELEKQFPGMKNVKDKDALDKALGEIEKVASKAPKAEGSEEMKTFGELIKEVKLPGSDEPADEKKSEA